MQPTEFCMNQKMPQNAILQSRIMYATLILHIHQ